jgi:hypothetical protein
MTNAKTKSKKANANTRAAARRRRNATAIVRKVDEMRKQARKGTVESQELANRTTAALIHMIDYVVAGSDIVELTAFKQNASVSTLTLKKAKVQEKTGPIPQAGLLGSGVLFLDSMNAPPQPTIGWLRAMVQEHLAASCEALVVVISASVVQMLLLDDTPEKFRHLALESWKQDQEASQKIRRRYQKQKRAETEFAAGTTACDWDYVRGYTSGVQAAVAAIAQAIDGNLSPAEICWALRVWQTAVAVIPDRASDSLKNGIYACSIAWKQSGISPATVNPFIMQAIAQSPETFFLLGWEVPSKTQTGWMRTRP